MKRWSKILGFAIALAAWTATEGWATTARERAEIYHKGRAALEDGLYEIAERYLEDYVRNAPTRREKAEGTVLLARALIGLKRYEEAVRRLTERAPWATKTPHESAFVFWKALALFELKRYEDALKELETFAQKYPQSPYREQAARLRTRCLVRLRKINEALQAFARFQETYPNSPDIPANLLEWASTLIDLGRKDEARKVFDQLLAKYPTSDAAAQGQLWLGSAYARMQEPEMAQEIFASVAKELQVRAEYRATAWRALAALHEAATNFAEATAALEQAKALEPSPVQRARDDMALSRLLIRQGRVAEGVALIKELCARQMDHPSPRELQRQLAQDLLEAGYYEQADEEFQHYLEAFGEADDLEVWLGKGWSLWGQKRYAEAIAAFRRVADSDAPARLRAQALYKMGDCYFVSKQYNPAAAAYRRIYTEFPDEPLAAEARYQAAESLAALGLMSEAEELLDQIANAAQGDLAIRAKLRKATLYEQTDRVEAALETYRELLQPDAPARWQREALYNRGLLLYRTGRFSEALGDFERLAQEHPQTPEGERAFYLRGWCLYLSGQQSDALAISKEFLKRYPTSPWAAEVLYWMGEHLFNAGEYSEAEQYFVRLANDFPDSEWAAGGLYWAGRAAALRREFRRALEHLNRLAERYPTSTWLPECRFAQADVLAELGRFDAALLALEEITRKYPQHSLALAAWGRKGDCLYTLARDNPRRYGEALDAYQRVAQDPATPKDLKWQALYKAARCLERLGRLEDALSSYSEVVYGYLADAETTDNLGVVWFSRAALDAGALLESLRREREARRIYQRLIEVGAPGAETARERVAKLDAAL